MAEQSVTLQDVRDTLALPDGTDMAVMTEVTGERPAEIVAHLKDAEYIILGISPDEFMQRHGGDVFDFNALVESFKLICRDYERELQMETKSMAVDFCSKVIYYVGPQSRSVKQNTNDRTWAFKFPYYENRTLICKVAYVCTFKAKNATYSMKHDNPDKIVLSVRHASLLAMLTIYAACYHHPQ